ncbi:hypothetical protein FCH28_37685 [Streptomyces piniterrae]|uniref:Uncharacterized protein n=1 Tax=Streptomyces piniterrae TaxID=2571125 RepID=A0A4U0MKV2_9ACTN|nr:hypothetical protein [Streptomyces piniterrae]TJZ41219.1 hypothetical protein FCH28_37685 [Streptomyces piniterrae]
MTRHRCNGPDCYKLLPEASLHGGRPRLYCSERCRSRHRRRSRGYDHLLKQREERTSSAAEERHRLRTAAYEVAREARRLAAVLDDEADRPRYEQPAWSDRWFGRPGPEAPYTRATLELVETVHQALAAAVAADRAAGRGWTEIGEALGVSADTAARRYRPADRH